MRSLALAAEHHISLWRRSLLVRCFAMLTSGWSSQVAATSASLTRSNQLSFYSIGDSVVASSSWTRMRLVLYGISPPNVDGHEHNCGRYLA
ncbi:hypothetical protein KC19_VG024800 [Ceratodon purpureus]|uniref:Secreted protein n=1 Tax=Ceratodon purpureus TaxID=3225 RepID=A0A8T0HLN1_CERPU|nr:hypothetical protein KC19_VG024800 [Ceratodon purpureus]